MSARDPRDDGLEAELRGQGPIDPPAWVLDEVRIAIRATPQRRPRFRRTALTLALAAALIVAATAGWGLLGSSPLPFEQASPSADVTASIGPFPTSLASPSATRTLAPTLEPGTGWRMIAEGPLSPRWEAHAFWTGSEVLILGGDGARPPCPGECFWNPAIRADGAAYDPTADSWRSIRPAPVPLGFVSGAVLDEALYLLVEADTRPDGGPRRTDFLRYRIRDDAWDSLPLPEDGGVPGILGLVAAGSRVLAYPGSHEWGVLPIQAFDPGSGTWSRLPADPLAPAFDINLVWTGEDLVLLGKSIDQLTDPTPTVEPYREPYQGPASSSHPLTVMAAVLPGGSGEWQRLADSEIVGGSSWTFSGGKVISPTVGSSDGGATNNWGRFYPHGGLLTPGSWTWSPLPDPPLHEAFYRGPGASGTDYVVASNGWVLQVSTARWIELAASPIEVNEGQTVVWAGDRLLVWGGLYWGPHDFALDPWAGELLSEGAIWEP